MNSIISRRTIVVSLMASLCVLRGGEVEPRTADSPDAQRIRDLTLIGGTTASSSSAAEVSAAKVRVLVALGKALHERLVSIDARLREIPGNDESMKALRAEREALLKHENEVGEMLKRAASEADSGLIPTKR